VNKKTLAEKIDELRDVSVAVIGACETLLLRLAVVCLLIRGLMRILSAR
jgi:hypothetical protein